MKKSDLLLTAHSPRFLRRHPRGWLRFPGIVLIILLLVGLFSPLARAEQFGDFTYTSNGSAITITAYTGTGGAVAIPGTITGLQVRIIGQDNIGRGAFAYKTSVTSVSIPNGVTSIGDWVFSGCTGMTGLAIPDSVTSIGEYAFYGCTGLTGITIPVGVTTMKTGAFSGCTGVLAFQAAAGNTAFSSAGGVLFNKLMTALLQCPTGKAGSYDIPGGVTSIGEGAFDGCLSLTDVTIPVGVTSIGFSAFSGCTGLTTVTIPNGVTSIGEQAFSQCTGLTGVTIPGSVTSIEGGAFGGCSGLTTVAIPASVLSIEAYAFLNCSKLASAVFEGNAPSLGFVIFDNAAAGFQIYYYTGSTGFTTPTWKGYPAVAISRPVQPATPPNIISSLSREAGKFTLGVGGKAGATYQLQRRLDLTAGAWQTITTAGPLAADETVNLQDLQAPVDKAFYRIVATGL